MEISADSRFKPYPGFLTAITGRLEGCQVPDTGVDQFGAEMPAVITLTGLVALSWLPPQPRGPDLGRAPPGE